MAAVQPDSYLADLNEAQREAVLTTEGPLLVIAGAGSGKTRVLTYRVAHLLAACGVEPNEILAITFTNKAAGEMRERIEAAVGPKAHAIWILTFHSACGRILRREAPRLGYRSNFTIYDQADQLRGEVPISAWRRAYRTRESEIVQLLTGATVRWPQVTIGSYPRFLPDGPEVEVVLKSADAAALAAAVAWLEPALDDVVRG